uniref:MIR domain-containing protein n=1 Tax=Macrostomum lignano TaxID=282301 RepID=A0A1I8FE30_9PLAT
LSAEAEAHDNDMEQARQRGKKVLYGQMIQLQHAFTGKYVHISTQNTSPTESSNMQVTLNPDNAGAAQFKVMPRFKVKGEGDLVQIEDQVILESVKSPGQYLHVGRVKCKQYIPVYENSFELKPIGAIQRPHPGSFTPSWRPTCVCEGSFNEVPVEDVHLRIRAVDQSKPKTLMKPSSAICYWQLELVENAISGGIVKRPGLTDDRTDANTVFRLHQVLKEDGEINDATYCRIQHAATKNWLHASKEDYNRRGLPGEGKSSNSMAGLIWSQAPLRKVEMTQKSQCDDAFTIYAVEPQLVNIFNYVAGYVPLIQRFIFDHKTGSSKLEPIITQPMVKALLELRDFIVFDIDNNKNRTKLLRNLRLVDLLFRVLSNSTEREFANCSAAAAHL